MGHPIAAEVQRQHSPPVHQEFDRPKDELWQRHGPEWMTILTGILGTTGSFRLCYRHLVATDSAIITVADEPNRISALRRELVPILPVPGSLSAGELVHTTLFRYARPLRDPASLVRWLAATEFGIDVDVSEFLVVREHTLDRQKFEAPGRLPCGHGAGHPRRRVRAQGAHVLCSA